MVQPSAEFLVSVILVTSSLLTSPVWCHHWPVNGNIPVGERPKGVLKAMAAHVNSAPEPDFEFTHKIPWAFVAHFSDPKCEEIQLYAGYPTNFCSPMMNGSYVAHFCGYGPNNSSLIRLMCSDDLCTNCTELSIFEATSDQCSPAHGGYQKLICPKSGLSPIFPSKASPNGRKHVQARDYYLGNCFGPLRMIRGYVADGCKVDLPDLDDSGRYLLGSSGQMSFRCDEGCGQCNTTVSSASESCLQKNDQASSTKIVSGSWVAAVEEVAQVSSASRNIGPAFFSLLTLLISAGVSQLC